ncbi:hypothetical protein GCM10027361_39870 [Erwinia aphidicola]
MLSGYVATAKLFSESVRLKSFLITLRAAFDAGISQLIIWQADEITLPSCRTA